MKTVRGPWPMFTTTVLNHRCRFENYLATVPDPVADFLMEKFQGQFAIIHSFEKTKAQRILVVRDMGLGDVMLITPIVRALKSQGASVVDVATRKDYQPLFDGNPYVSKTIPLQEGKPIPSQEYEAVIDLRLSVEQAENAGLHKNRVTAFGEAAGISLTAPEDVHLDYYVRPEETEWAKSVVSPMRDGQMLAVFVWCSSTQNRNWSVERRQQMIMRLAAEGCKVVVLHYEQFDLGPALGLPDVISGGAKFSIRQCAALISIADFVVSPDTGLFHIAQAMDKPTVSYFGAFSLKERKSSEAAIDISVSGCHMKPCRQYYCMNKAADGTSKCLAVTGDQLMQGVALAAGL